MNITNSIFLLAIVAMPTAGHMLSAYVQTGLVEIINKCTCNAGLISFLCRWMQMQGTCGICAL